MVQRFRRYLARRNFNYENILLFFLVILIVSVGLDLILDNVPGAENFFVKAKLALIVVVGWIVFAVYCLLPCCVGPLVALFMNWLDEKLGEDFQIHWFMKLLGHVGVVVLGSMLYLLFLPVLCQVAVLGTIYNQLFDLSALRESVFTQSGWIVWAVLGYFCGLFIAWMFDWW